MTETESKSLVNIEALNPAEVFVPNGGQKIIDTIAAEIKGFEADIKTEEGRKAIISLDRKIASDKRGIDKMRTDFTAKVRAQLDEINAEGKRIFNSLEDFQKEIYQPLQDWKDAEKRRVDALEENISEIKSLADFTVERDSEQLKAALAEAIARSNDGFNWEDFADRAKETIESVIIALKDKISVVEQREKEQAELEQLRKDKADREAADRAEQLRKEGEARAKEEQAERERELERQKAANEQNRINMITTKNKDMTLPEGCTGWSSLRIEAALKSIETIYERGGFDEFAETAKATYENSTDLLVKEYKVATAREAQEEQERKEKEEADKQAAIDAAAAKATAEAKAEQERKEKKEKEEADAREKDKAHRARVNNAAIDALKISAPNVSDEDLKAILKAIVLKQIPNVSIQY